ncbi:hypothetical protein [Thiomonas sp.]
MSAIKRIRITALQLAQRYIAAAPRREIAEILFDRCNSASAFNKLHNMPRAIRKLATQFSLASKTRFRTGLITSRHVALAIECMAKRMKRVKGQVSADFMHFILCLGAWAIRIAAVIMPSILEQKRQSADARQIQIDFDTLFS